jgi:hypothetical protein
MKKNTLFEDFVKSLEKLTPEEGKHLFVQFFIMLLEGKWFETLHVFLMAQKSIKKMFYADELVYYAVDEIATTDSLQCLNKRRKLLLEFWRYLQHHDPTFFSEVFRRCCLRHITNDEDWKDLSVFFEWDGFGDTRPSQLFDPWLKELLMFQAKMAPDSEDTNRVIFTQEFSLRFAKRTIGELHSVERNHCWNKKWEKDINCSTLETFIYLASVIDLIISRSIALKDEYGILISPANEFFPEAAKQITQLDDSYGLAVKRLRECAAFFIVLNPVQFEKAVGPHKFSHYLDEFKAHYLTQEGQDQLLSKEWYRSIKGIAEFEFP